jgi:O-antigen/teichoic acid export membrane protein
VKDTNMPGELENPHNPTHMHRPLLRKLVEQGALLFSGYAGAQLLAFARNALLGHWLSKGDFGIAATITLMFQLIEMTTDLGADRLIIQAKDGDEPRLAASLHTMLVLRGTLTALVLLILAGPITTFFGIEEARWAFEAVALAPFVRGFMHLDPRRAQRRLDNRPLLITELFPQAACLVLTLPAIFLTGGYGAIVFLSVAQALLSVAASHALAERRYALSFEGDDLRRIFAFGWPILLSALPLVAVYQGDRILIGRFLGMEALAGYTAAFMITMIPGLFAAKIAHALMLPMLAEVQDEPEAFTSRYIGLTETTCVGAALYVSIFVLAGGAILPLAFGSSYAGQDLIISWLALMWALRMIQTVPGMALMAQGDTRPFPIAGLYRAAALIPALAAAYLGYGLAEIAAVGVAGELASLVYVAFRASSRISGLDRILLSRSLIIAPAAFAALGLRHLLPQEPGLFAALSGVILVWAMILAFALAVMPRSRGILHAWHGTRLATTISTVETNS